MNYGISPPLPSTAVPLRTNPYVKHTFASAPRSQLKQELDIAQHGLPPSAHYSPRLFGIPVSPVTFAQRLLGKVSPTSNDSPTPAPTTASGTTSATTPPPPATIHHPCHYRSSRHAVHPAQEQPLGLSCGDYLLVSPLPRPLIPV